MRITLMYLEGPQRVFEDVDEYAIVLKRWSPENQSVSDIGVQIGDTEYYGWYKITIKEGR